MGAPQLALMNPLIREAHVIATLEELPATLEEIRGWFGQAGYRVAEELLESGVLGLQEEYSIDEEEGPQFVQKLIVIDPQMKRTSINNVGSAAWKLIIENYEPMMISEDQIADFCVELNDRFGAPPPVAARLVQLARLRIAAHCWGISSIHIEDQYAVFGYTSPRLIGRLAKQSAGALRVADNRSAYLPVAKRVAQPDDLLAYLESVLQPP